MTYVKARGTRSIIGCATNFSAEVILQFSSRVNRMDRRLSNRTEVIQWEARRAEMNRLVVCEQILS